MNPKKNKHLFYKRTHGGIVGIADTATYELLQSAAVKYYRNYPVTRGMAKYTCPTNKTGKNKVQAAIRVEMINSDTYTVNFYNTTCTMLLNGKNVEKVLYNDIADIHNIVSTCKFNGQEVNLKNINEMFATALRGILETMKSKSDGNSGTAPKNNQYLKQITDANENIQCIKCERNCRKKASYCTKGKHWCIIIVKNLLKNR